MKVLYYFLLLGPILTINKAQNVDSNCKNSAFILEKSNQFHDPTNTWSQWNVKFHIQEPRLKNPQRYSIVNLNQADKSFSLVRSRDENISEHIIDKNGIATTLFNKTDNFPEALKEKYRLDPDKNFSYREFYEVMYGLPMSLKNRIKTLNPATTATIDNQEVYIIDLTLDKPMFTDHWKVLINKEKYQIIGIELINDENPSAGEILDFEGLIDLDGIKVPRIRHWYEPTAKAYQGSDIIIKPVEE